MGIYYAVNKIIYRNSQEFPLSNRKCFTNSSVNLRICLRQSNVLWFCERDKTCLLNILKCISNFCKF